MVAGSPRSLMPTKIVSPNKRSEPCPLCPQKSYRARWRRAQDSNPRSDLMVVSPGPAERRMACELHLGKRDEECPCFRGFLALQCWRPHVIGFSDLGNQCPLVAWRKVRAESGCPTSQDSIPRQSIGRKRRSIEWMINRRRASRFYSRLASVATNSLCDTARSGRRPRSR